MNTFINKFDKKIFNEIHILNTEPQFVECIIYVKNFELSRDFFYEYKPSILEVIHEYPFLNAFGIRIKTENLTRLAQLSQIVFISSKTTIYAQVNKAKEVLNLNKFYSENLSGKNVCVAIIDTGIAPHMDFLIPFNHVSYFYDFVNNQSEIYDDNGHGTIVSGIIAGSGIKGGKKNIGIAPMSELVILKCLNEKGQTTTIEMLNAMQWIFDNYKKYNIKIVCMSFGATPISENDPLIMGAEVLWNEGIIVVAAAGNSGPEYHSIKSPGSSKKIITVGSIDDGRNIDNSLSFDKKNLSIPDFSSRGPAFGLYKPDLLTPGVDIVSTNREFGYGKMSGTSVSTPIVAGVCALIMEKYHNNIAPNQVKELLLSNCHSIGKDRNSEGFGYLRF